MDTAVGRLLEARFRLGMFDPPALVPYAKIPATEYDTPEHDALALRMARESVVLLKNDGLLPLDRAKIRKIAVLGVNANYVRTLLGNYDGEPSHPVTFARGIPDSPRHERAGLLRAAAARWPCGWATPTRRLMTTPGAKALELAQTVDAIIYVGGICADLEREFMGVPFEGFYHGDRTRIELPPVQTEFLKALRATGKPLVFVNCSGSAMAMPWEAENLPAIVQAWYPGQEGGRARGGSPVRRCQPGGKAAGHFLPRDRGPAAVHGLFHGQPHLPLFQGQALVRLRARLELHAIQVWRRATGQDASQYE